MILLDSCSRQDIEQPQEVILARVGDKTISLSEFTRRAEYTIRPPYCNTSLTPHKMIVLNSLIAEKLLAIEASDTNSFITHRKIEDYLTGLKEQAMRQWQYNEQATNKVRLDTVKIANTLHWAERVYKIAYLYIPDSVFVNDLYLELTQFPDEFTDILTNDYGVEAIPQREVQWHDSENDAILDALFSGPLEKNQILPPVRINSTEYVLIKILGWTRTPTITQTQLAQKFEKIADRYRQRGAKKRFKSYVQQVMKGKQIDFKAETFFKLASILGPVYLKSSKEKQDEMNEIYWGVESPKQPENTREQLDQIRDYPLFTIADQTWTVDDLMKQMAHHPLVFRQHKMKNAEFGQQLQLAIMDLVRDKYLTEEAYKAGCDQVNVIKRNVGMWKDSFNAQFYRDRYLKDCGIDTLTGKNYVQVIDQKLNPLIDSLQHKYSDQIEINTEEFNKIKLTHIDMVVTYNDEPYPMVVPPFPQLTTDQRLDYGRKMDQQGIKYSVNTGKKSDK